MPWSGGGLLFCLAFLVWANSYVTVTLYRHGSREITALDREESVFRISCGVCWTVALALLLAGGDDGRRLPL